MPLLLFLMESILLLDNTPIVVIGGLGFDEFIEPAGDSKLLFNDVTVAIKNVKEKKTKFNITTNSC